MRVALVSEHASPLAALGGVDAGGQNVHVAALASELGRRGIDVTVHTRRDDRALPAVVPLDRGVRVHHVEAGPPEPVPKDELLPYMDDFAAVLLERWTTTRPDVVHSHFWMSGRAALAAARPLGIPLVHTFHALDVVRRRHQGAKHRSPAEWLRVERELVRRADRLVAQCSDEVFELVRLGADMHRIVIAPSGVDVDLFRPEGDAELRPPDGHRLVCITRLVERKGVGNAIEALARLPGVELVVGGGPDRSRLERDVEYRRLRTLAESLGVADRVEFRGRIEREDLPPLFRSADAAVCVPWYEPFGIVPLEAMACGTPVIASAVGGPLDTVVDEVTGLHVPPRRPDAIAAAARRLLEDGDLRRTLGEGAARRVRVQYTWARCASRVLATYASALSDVGPVAREVQR